jgi:hypothetical protein
MDERSAKRQLTITQAMETGPNDLDDDTHKAMDEEILDTMGDDPYNPSHLLTLIVNASSERLDQQYVNPFKAKALIKANPKLKEMLDVAWESKSFKIVRNLRLWTYPRTRNLLNRNAEILRFSHGALLIVHPQMPILNTM